MGAGRFLCVALPIILTICSIATLLYATLSGVAHENLRLFRLDVRNLSIDPADVDNIADKVLGIDFRRDVKTSNITAADLGLDDYYDVTLWGYCSPNSKGKKTCTKHQFDWASKYVTTDNLKTDSGITVQLPKEIVNALKAFRTVTKWAEIAFIVALIALGVELFIGIFSNFSRIVSCLTWLESIITTVLVFAAAGLSTAMALIIVGAVDSTAKFYGVHGSVDTGFLAVVWISAAFALGANLFWIFTICCCKPEKRSKNRGTKNLDHDSEKLLPGFKSRGYAPLNNDHDMSGAKDNYYNPSQSGSFAGPQYPSGNGRSDLAYEPYSHRA
ncbi:hypothetical protein PT974_06242 [Cladobotryum mycophilum]|uniref:Integral membrane protein n=1 Tax=Cladobotryum mycophilum TaxID=491253 RepID=A0ABR0SLQ5_9HYPO